MADGKDKAEAVGDDPASAITIPPFPPGSVRNKAAADEQSSESAADRLVAKDHHQAAVQTRGLRQRFSWVVSGLVLFWMLLTYALLLFQGTHRFFRLPFDLSEKVMVVALGTVTLNVIGLLVIILRFVFPGGEQDRSKAN